MATDAEILKAAGLDKLPRFKRDTPTPDLRPDLMTGETDPVRYVHVDMRGNVWVITWDAESDTWSVMPRADTYGMPGGKLAFFGETPAVLLDAIEVKAEEWRIANKPQPTTVTPPTSSGDGLGLLLLLAVVILADGGKRRR